MMPSYQYGSCLERHEWNKHGTCQILSPDQYFSLAMGLTNAVQNSAFGQYLIEHRGETVKLSMLRQFLNESFGEANGSKISLACNQGILVDIWIQLPPLIPATESLQALINQAPVRASRDACPSHVRISNFTSEF